MQNTTLAEVIEELQQQYEAVGNIPVKLLENESSLVLVYDKQPKEEMYFITGNNVFIQGAEIMYAMNETGSNLGFGTYDDCNNNGYRFSKHDAIKIASKMNSEIMFFNFDINPVHTND